MWDVYSRMCSWKLSQIALKEFYCRIIFFLLSSWVAKYLFQYHLCNRWCRLITAIHRWHWWCCNILALLRRNVIFKILICHVCNNQGLLHRNIGFKILKNPLSIPFSKLLSYKDPDLDSDPGYWCGMSRQIQSLRQWIRSSVTSTVRLKMKYSTFLSLPV